MKHRMNLFATFLFTITCGGESYAQVLPFNSLLLPSNPTSADSLKLIIGRPCSDVLLYKSNAYHVSMAQNNITVMRGEIVPYPVPTCPPSPPDEIDLGRLPAGNYTLTVVNAAIGSIPSSAEFVNVPFTVTDARLTKAAPYVRLDYSGQWWDPNDSGWGLFIWHDARDRVLAAWFTYAPDGKPMWYVFQPTWQTSSATVEVPLMQTSRPPGTTSPPPNPTPGTVAYTLAGTVSLDFTNYGTADEGKLTYMFNGGPKLVRTIQRFMP